MYTASVERWLDALMVGPTSCGVWVCMCSHVLNQLLTHQARQLHFQQDPSNGKADADKNSKGHSPVPPTDPKKAQVLPVSHCQVFLLSFYLLHVLTDPVKH